MRNQSQLDIFEFDREFLVLQPDAAVGKLRVMYVQGSRSVQ
jgi:hypothetical protein